MVKKEFSYRGKTIEQLKALTLEEFATILPARQRRTLKRGLKDPQKKLLKRARAWKKGEKPIKTHVRSMIILPELVGTSFAVHDGKDWNIVEVKPEMVGHYLGEYSMTRERVSHSGPGIGATRGTKFVAIK